MSLFKKLFGKKHKEEEQDLSVQEVVQDLQDEGTRMPENTTADENELQDDTISEEGEEIVSEPQVMDTEEKIEEIEQVSEEKSAQEELQNEVDKQRVVETYDIELEEVENAQATVIEELDIQPVEEVPQKQGFIKRLFIGLSKTRDSILKSVDDVLSNFKHIDEDLYEELEEVLIMADFGVDTTLHIMEKLKVKVKEDKISDPAELKPALQTIITGILTEQPVGEVLNEEGPTVVLVIGVNGVGKTTSIGKMSHLFKSQGKKVLVAAADTFRAAAIEQLNVWTQRAEVEIIKHEEGSDAAAVVFDAIAAAKSRKTDVLICDTAGRLQNKTNLMKELEKISRIIAREYPEAKKEILIVIDATTGQNAIQQVKLFKEVADINGIILTKLDGTAKGGAIVGIYESLKVPVKYIGVGEKIDDLQPFDANTFAKALFEEEA